MNFYDDVDKLIDAESRLLNYRGEDEIISAYDMLDVLAAREKEQHEVVLSTGFPTLDAENSIRHFIGGELVVISGPTKHGKTLFAQTLTRSFHNQDKVALWFSYEVPALQFLKQFGDSIPSFVLPKTLKDNSLSWIIERTHEAKLKYNISAVFIDNTQNIVNLTMNNLTQVVGELVKACKKMALTFNIVVFLLHHMKKLKIDAGEEITSESLRDSSMVAQTADTVMFVWRDPDIIVNPNKSYLKITENRRYGIMNQIISMRKQGNYLEEIEFRYGK